MIDFDVFVYLDVYPCLFMHTFCWFGCNIEAGGFFRKTPITELSTDQTIASNQKQQTFHPKNPCGAGLWCMRVVIKRVSKQLLRLSWSSPCRKPRCQRMMRHDVWTFQSSLPAESCLGCSASNTSLWASWADVTWMHPLQISILSVFPWSSLWNLCVSYLCVLHHFHASCHIISDHFTFWAQG